MGRIRPVKQNINTIPTLIPNVVLKKRETDIPHKSFSQVSLYMDCGYKYKLSYLTEHIRIPAVNLIIGSHGHKYFENILSARLQHHDYNQTQLNDLMKNQQNEMMKEIDKGVEEFGIKLDFQRDFIADFFIRLLEKWNVDFLPEADPVAVEAKYEITIGGELFVAYVDLIRKLSNKQLEIVDWKWVAAKKSDFDAKASLQLSLYSYMTGIPNVNLVSMVKPKKKNNPKNWVPRVEHAKSTRGKTDHKWAEIVIMDVLEGMKVGYYPKCSPENYLCSPLYCNGWDVCRGAIEPKSPDWLG